jgi:membrane protein YqaA with SNARE-associated domain
MRLVTYSWLAVVIGVACAAIGWLGLAGWMAALVVAASIAGHVAGNALGTRMREATDRDLARTATVQRVEYVPSPAPPTRLQRRSSLGRLVVVSAGVGGASGGLIGAAALWWLAASSLAGAVFGGLLGFLLASFVEIVRTSVREAIAAERRG